ncbi:MAG: hypothetical protein ACT4QE_26770 [Anaerolineales bacterium]
MGIDSALQRFIELLPAVIATAAVAWLILALLSWAANTLTGQNNRRVTEFANIVMGRSVLRRDRWKTLGKILNLCVQELGATSGAILVAPTVADRLDLVSAPESAGLATPQRIPWPDADAATHADRGRQCGSGPPTH